MGDGEAVDGLGTRDPGLARERTDLAWNRSGLAVLVAVTILLRRLWPLHGDKSVVALVLIAAGAIFWVAGRRVAQRARFGAEVDGVLGVSTCRMLTIGTLVLAAAGFLLGVLSPG
jgi:uncharacterized membrane protein YidH (DUF202 family)